MERIKKVQVTLTKNGISRVVATYNSIRKAEQFIEDFGERLYPDNATPADYYSTITRIGTSTGCEFYKHPDYWHSREEIKIGEMAINIIRG